MHRAGWQVGRGTFVVLVLMLALLTACAEQGMSGRRGLTPSPTPRPIDTIPGIGEAPPVEGMPNVVQAQREELIINEDGELGPESVNFDPGVSVEIVVSNLSENDVSLGINLGGGSTAFNLPGSTQQGSTVTFTRQSIFVTYDDAGTYEIVCLGGCKGTVNVVVGEGEAEPAEGEDLITEPTEEAAAPTEEAAEPMATAAPMATAVVAPTITPTTAAAPAAPTVAATATATTVAATATATTVAPTAQATAAATPEAAAPSDTGSEPAISGDAEAGKALFNQPVFQSSSGIASGCYTCHYVEASRGNFTGPNLAGVGSRAATTVSGLSAAEYLYNSIVNPNDYVVEGFVAGLMPQNYGEVLTQEQIDNLVAYLLTLK